MSSPNNKNFLEWLKIFILLEPVSPKLAFRRKYKVQAIFMPLQFFIAGLFIISRKLDAT